MDGKKLFKPVKTTKKPDEVFKQFLVMIRSGKIIPGDKLPSEREMASLLGISRQFVREAIYRAQGAGLVEVRQGEGCFVVSSIKKDIESPLRLLLEEEAAKIFEFLEIRRLLEGWCAARAAISAEEDDFVKLQEILERMEEADPTDAKWAKEDTDFHLAIASATKNVLATHIMYALKDTFESYFRIRRITTRDERKGPLLQQHKEIFKEIKARDADLARQRTNEHIDYIDKLISEDLLKK